MRILGLDVGTKTVGVAISDEMGWTAQGLETIKINEERGEFGFNRISELVKQYNVDKIVVGLPKNMNGTIGPRGEACQQFAEKLHELVQRWLKMAAKPLLISADVSRKKRKQGIDKMAAVVILQGYLDSK